MTNATSPLKRSFEPLGKAEQERLARRFRLIIAESSMGPTAWALLQQVAKNRRTQTDVRPAAE